ncbi:hypothetical protein JB92DRAFT_3031225 [Gautieria morchelliformis]|nr:hypothetical protein JB92DRAFT_3031225 [Gautieria morchelliformis]
MCLTFEACPYRSPVHRSLSSHASCIYVLLMFFFPFSSAAPCPRTRTRTNSTTCGRRTCMPTPIHIRTQACRCRWSTIQGPPSCSRLSASPHIPKPP